MKNFKNEYKDFFNEIKLNETQKEKITLKSTNRNNNILKKWTCATCLMLLIAATGFSIVFASDIVESIKKHIYKIDTKEIDQNGKKTFSNICSIEYPVLNIVKTNTYKINDRIDIKELSNDLEIKLLTSSSSQNDTFLVENVNEKGENIRYLSLSKEKTISGNELANNSLNGYINTNIGFITKEANIKDDEKNIAFKKWNCTEENFEIYHSEILSVDIYIIQMGIKYNWNEPHVGTIQAFFIKNNILYTLIGKNISVNIMIDYINSLK